MKYFLFSEFSRRNVSIKIFYEKKGIAVMNNSHNHQQQENHKINGGSHKRQFSMKLINQLSYANLVWLQERALWRTFLVLVAFLRFSPHQPKNVN
ncbi:hypothetical protein AAJ76_5000028107 [Vairimorpha ceranae]|uniref:Uncharacterized protein n=1 Tax=Vairimorpha ceranae TaxID=40302 RepID=A0A0F9WAU4_9MICR|nr:hypothetical protein AAJ76_5000028107 [Vairimorpha ceranae]KKO74711.1 hypothetical protein AAJ76_5000028107 [Vairimorpha ceranae]